MTDKPIRLAIVRCDSHAYWYAPFFGEIDVERLGSFSSDAPTRQSIYHYGTKVGNYRQLSIEPVAGFEVTKVFDAVGDRDGMNTDPKLLQYGTYPGRGEEFAKTFAKPPVVCHTIEETATDVDAVFLADSSSPKEGADHPTLARPFLEKGIPCFVDKPFSLGLADGKAMIDMAKQNGTALMSVSLLSHTETGNLFKNRIAELPEPGLLVVKGAGFRQGAVIHGLSLALAMFGGGVKSVECMGLSPGDIKSHWNLANPDYCLEHILLLYPDDRQAIVMNTGWYPPTSEFYCSVYSKKGVIHSDGIGDQEFLSAGTPIIEMFRKLVQTGKPVVPYDDILEAIAIIDAALLAQKEGRRVAMEEVWQREDASS
jgi:predicted dehydrogenase